MEFFGAFWAAVIQFIANFFSKKQQDNRDKERDFVENYSRDVENCYDSGISALIRHRMEDFGSNEIALKIIEHLKTKYNKDPLGKHRDLIVNYNKEKQVPADPNDGVLGFFKRITLDKYNAADGHIDVIISKWYNEAKNDHLK